MSKQPPKQADNSSDTSTIKVLALNYPFMNGEGDTVSEITMRRAKIKELRKMEQLNKSDADKEMWIMSQLTGLVPEDLGEMDAWDYRQLQLMLEDIVGKPQA